MVKASNKVNFAAGPACVPQEVLDQVQEGISNFDNTGLSVMEISHRSKEFSAVIKECEDRLRDLFTVPENYSILLMHGGGTGQFAGVPMNMSQREEDAADYLITGHWSNLAAKEAEKYLQVRKVLPEGSNSLTIAPPSTWTLSDNSKYIYYCDNETIHGIEFPKIGNDYTNSPIATALVSAPKPLISDMSSNMGSRIFDVSKYGMLFASAQKNMGIPGVCIGFARNDLIGNHRKITPNILNWQSTAKAHSTQNTPVVISIFVLRELLRWMAGKGGLDYFEDVSRKKAALIYDAVDASQGYYTSCVAPEYRSRMNVVFGLAAGEAAEKKFIHMAEHEHELVQLNGHRSVGRMRASLYNSISVEDVRRLVDFMGHYQSQHA